MVKNWYRMRPMDLMRRRMRMRPRSTETALDPLLSLLPDRSLDLLVLTAWGVRSGGGGGRACANCEEGESERNS